MVNQKTKQKNNNNKKKNPKKTRQLKAEQSFLYGTYHLNLNFIPIRFHQNMETQLRSTVRIRVALTLKAPITTAADDIHKYFYISFQRK